MPGPLLLAGIGAGLKLLGGLAKGQGEKKKAKAADKAARATHQVSEKTRANRNRASQAMLKSLFGGRYAMDEGAFGELQQSRPYTGADPAAGLGWGMAGEGLGAAGDVATMAAISQYGQPPTASTPAGPPISDISMGIPGDTESILGPGVGIDTSSDLIPFPEPPDQISLTPWIR